jgi:hypothetical protein
MWLLFLPTKEINHWSVRQAGDVAMITKFLARAENHLASKFFDNSEGI